MKNPKKSGLKSVSVLRFKKLNNEREKAIQNAPAKPLPSDYPVNRLSRELHPEKQYVKVSEIKAWDENCKSFTLVPDSERGTASLAYFQSGAYLCLIPKIGGKEISRPYSISSSPKESLEGKYVVTIKRVKDGLVSNYMLDQVKKDDTLAVSGPLGEFHYLPVRDAKTVIGVAGGSGITPFHSFAKAIVEGTEDFQLILLYGSRTEKDILFKEDFDRFQILSDKIKVVHVLSDEEKEGYEHGFISADLIRKYAPDGNFSIFLCGPAAMYRFLDQEIQKFNLEQKWVRHELQGEIHEPRKLADYPADRSAAKEIKITVKMCEKEQTIKADTDCTILQSLEKSGIAAPSRCRSGECGWCHSLLLSGEVYCPKIMEHRREADKKYNYIHLCCTFPLTDISVEIPYED